LSYPTPINKENLVDYNLTNEDEDIIIAESSEGGETVLASLKEELKRVVKNAPIVLNVPSRSGMSIKFDTNVEAKTLQNWRKACNNKQMPDNFDSLKFSSIVIANQATEIHFKGELAVDETGELLNFRNQKFLEMLDAPKAVEGVRRLYGVDGHIFVAADEILRAAGYDSEGQEQQEDPTLVS